MWTSRYPSSPACPKPRPPARRRSHSSDRRGTPSRDIGQTAEYVLASGLLLFWELRAINGSASLAWRGFGVGYAHSKTKRRDSMRKRSASLYLALSMVFAALPLFAAQPERCGTRQPSDAEIAAIEKAVARGKKGKSSAVVPVWVHVISAGTSVAEGNVSDSAIREQ